MHPEALALSWHASILAAVRDYAGKEKVMDCAGNPRMNVCETEQY